MKADSEFERIRRGAARSPFSAEHQKRIEENIHGDYAPHGALTRSLNIKVETEVIPLIDRLIDSELALRKQYGCPFSQDRIDLVGQRLRGLIAELWEYIVNASCHDAELHVIENTGGLEDYKREELRERADDLLNKSPSVLIDIVDQKLRAAMAEFHTFIFAALERLGRRPLIAAGPRRAPGSNRCPSHGRPCRPLHPNRAPLRQPRGACRA